MRIPVLCYHGVTAHPLPVKDWCFMELARFSEQMEYLAARCEVIALRDVPARAAGSNRGRPPVAITFDDGLAGYRTNALPILRRHHFHSTIFITTGPVLTGKPLWYCRVHEAVSRCPPSSFDWEGETYALSDSRSRSRASADLQRRFKALHPWHIEARVDVLVRQLLGEMQAGADFTPLGQADVRALAREDLVDIGAHTVNHAILSRLDASEQHEEIRDSLRVVSELTGGACDLFAYPNGTRGDFTVDTKNILARLGVTMAVTTETAAATARCERLEVPRYCVGGDIGLDAFAATIERLCER